MSSPLTKSDRDPALSQLPSLPRLIRYAWVPLLSIGVCVISLAVLLSPVGDLLSDNTRMLCALVDFGLMIAALIVLGVILYQVSELTCSLSLSVVGAAAAADAMANGDFTLARTLPATRVREGALLHQAVRYGARRIEELTAGLEDQVAVRTAELELAKEQAQAARNLAEEASKAKNMFLASMGHELRTPLNAIIGYAEMVSEELADREAESVRDVHQIATAARHLLALINDILDYTKSEAGRMEVRRDPYLISEVLDETVIAVKPLVGQQRNRLRVDIDPRLNSATGDAVKLRQILINLIGNAAKFTEDGEIRVRAHAHEDGTFSIAVADDGAGMDAQQQAHLFVPFQTNSAQQRHGGSGLGLAICHHFCRLMGGTISCQSEYGVGSVFTIRLPIHLEGRDESGVRVRTGMIKLASWTKAHKRKQVSS